MAVLCHRSHTGWMPARCHQQNPQTTTPSITPPSHTHTYAHPWGIGEEDASGCAVRWWRGTIVGWWGGHRWAPASEVESNKNRLARLINMVHSGLQRQPRVQLTFLFTVRGKGGCCGEGVASTKMTIILKNGEPRKTVRLCRTTLSHSAKTQCYAWYSSVAKLVAAAFVLPPFHSHFWVAKHCQTFSWPHGYWDVDIIPLL